MHPQLVPSRWETAEASRTTARTADPCRTSLELTQMRKLHCNRRPRGNLGRTLSASLLFRSIWRARPPALEGLTLPRLPLSISGSSVYFSLPDPATITRPLEHIGYVPEKHGSSRRPCLSELLSPCPDMINKSGNAALPWSQWGMLNNLRANKNDPPPPLNLSNAWCFYIHYIHARVTSKLPAVHGLAS